MNTEEKPKVSVVIPNYNHAEFLKQRIDSVLGQEFQDFEVIILDDNSRDNSRVIIDAYRFHPKVSHIVFNEENSGTTFKQWEKGISLAKGEWIWIAESDDWCEPTLLKTLMVGVDNSCVIAFCQSLVVHTNGQIFWNTSAEKLDQSILGKEFISNKMLLGNAIINASMCVFRKEAFYKVDKSFTDYKFCGDWLVWIEIALQGNVYSSGKILNYFRKHDKDVSGNAYAKGILYSEHLRLLNFLESKYIISNLEKQEVIVKKIRDIASDSRVDKGLINRIKIEFYKNLDFNFFYKSRHILGEKLFLKSLYPFILNYSKK
ncbi:glycosyltransferase family 2 protein [Hymenobacter norwichensis]|uniref:glycosyltransferase family 2 protein n=1 Tax=Hymenobacter norwichensis TaxID=223903 RepID=UPI0003FA22D8|nr:glycosyltransferase family 2 protein [Hymenobacter norwichensis]